MFLRWWKAHLSNCLIMFKVRLRNLKKHIKDILKVLFYLFKNKVKLSLKYIRRVRKVIHNLIPTEFHSQRDFIDMIPDF